MSRCVIFNRSTELLNSVQNSIIQKMKSLGYPDAELNSIKRDITIESLSGYEGSLPSDIHISDEEFVKGFVDSYIDKRKKDSLQIFVSSAPTSSVSNNIEFIEHEGSYAERTSYNASNSDITLSLATDSKTKGEHLTRSEANKAGKVYLGFHMEDKLNDLQNIGNINNIASSLFNKIKEKIDTSSIKVVTINISGNGLYSFKELNQVDLDLYLSKILESLYSHIKEEINKGNMPNFTLNVISGGQTGIDEAGIKASRALRSKYSIAGKDSIVAPSGWRFRDRVQRVGAEKSSMFIIFNDAVANNQNSIFIFPSSKELEVEFNTEYSKKNEERTKYDSKGHLFRRLSLGGTIYKNTIGVPIVQNVDREGNSIHYEDWDSYQKAIDSFVEMIRGLIHENVNRKDEGKPTKGIIFPQILGSDRMPFSKSGADHLAKSLKDLGIEYKVEKIPEKEDLYRLHLEKNSHAVELKNMTLEVKSEEKFKSRFSRGIAIDTANINFGSKENAILSNMAHRPFSIILKKGGERLFDKYMEFYPEHTSLEMRFNSVEQAFHVFKIFEYLNYKLNREELTPELQSKASEVMLKLLSSEIIGMQVKQIQEQLNIDSSFFNSVWKADAEEGNISYDIMKELIELSFKSESPEAVNALNTLVHLRSLGSTFTHNDNTGKRMDERFTKIINDFANSETSKLLSTGTIESVNIERDLDFTHMESKKIKAQSTLGIQSINAKAKTLAFLFRDTVIMKLEDKIQELQNAIDSSTLTADEIASREKYISRAEEYSFLSELTPIELQEIYQEVKNIIYEDYENAENGSTSKIELYRILSNFEYLMSEAIFKIRDELFMPVPLLDRSLQEMNDVDTSEDWELDIEEMPKESYNDNKSITSFERHSLRMKRFLSTIPENDPITGTVRLDTTGYYMYLSPGYVNKIILSYSKDLTHISELNTMIEQIVGKYPELAYLKTMIVDRINPFTGEYDRSLESIRSEFYNNFLVGYNTVTIQKEVEGNIDGIPKVETITINHQNAENLRYEEWVRNHEDKRQLEIIYGVENRLYNDNGYSTEAAIALLERLNDIKDTEIYKNKDITLEEINNIIKSNDFYILKEMHSILLNMGISIDLVTLKHSLITAYDSNEKVLLKHPISRLIRELETILKGVRDRKLVDSRDSTKQLSIFTVYSTAFAKISSILDYVDRAEIESNFRQDGKQISSYIKPYGLGELVKRIKSRYREGGTQKYIMDKYGRDSFLRVNGDTNSFASEWLNLMMEEGWAEHLETTLLYSVDGEEYQDWGTKYAKAIFHEFFYSSSEDGDVKARYAVPIMSDAHAARFVTFKRYVNRIDPITTNSISYKEQILPLYKTLIQQELERMYRVRQRALGFSLDPNHPSYIDPNLRIANYDMSLDDNGNPIPGSGGDKFHFIPELNTIKFKIEGYDEGTFTEIYNQIKDKANSSSDFSFNEIEEIDKLKEVAIQQYLEMEVAKNLRLYDKIFPTSSSDYQKLLGKIEEIRSFINNYSQNKELLDELTRLTNAIQYKTISIVSSIDRIVGLLDSFKIDDEKLRASVNSLYDSKIVKLEEKVSEFTWNSNYAQSQIFMLTIGDLAFFNGPKDVQKRFKQIHSPHTRLNTEAIWKGERIGTEIERSIYIKDFKTNSSILEDVGKYLDNLVEKGDMEEQVAKFIISKFYDINTTDGQSYRTLKSYKKVLAMAGHLTEEMDIAMTNIANGNPTYSDFNVLFQTIKPYAQGTTYVSDGLGGEILKPFQHKNSEAVLMAIYAAVNSFYVNNPQLQALNEFMDANNIDVAHFESAVKVGAYGVIDFNIDTLESLGITTREEMVEYLSSITQSSPSLIHEIDFSDYGFQMETPEHLIDTLQLVGTQVRKIVMGDLGSMSKNAILEIGNTKMSVEEWYKHYNAINTANIIDSFSEVNEVFSDIYKIEELLINEISSNPKYDKDLIDSVRINKETGLFNIPLEDPVITMEIQALLNSVLKNRINKQKMKGGSAILTSDFGFSEDLKVVTREDGTPEYVEVMLPAFSKQFIEPLLQYNKAMGKEGDFILDLNATIEVPIYENRVTYNEETGEKEIIKEIVGYEQERIINDKLLEAFGYRIPTENLYSTVPMKIVGFLPSQLGSSILMPKDIISLSGADFDIDKLYILLKEFREKIIYNEQDLFEYAKEGWKSDNLIRSNKSIEQYVEYLKANHPDKIERFKLGVVFKEVKYDDKKDELENSRAARNNRFIDLMRGMVTHPDNAHRWYKPGNFEILKTGSRVFDILNKFAENYDLELLEEITGKKGISNVYNYLQNIPLKELDKMLSEYQGVISNISLGGNLHFYLQNMTGNMLIGNYANHNMNHIIMQRLGTTIEPALQFGLDGVVSDSLSRDYDLNNKNLISDNLANFLAASVDNAKDPVLAGFKQNLITSNISEYIIRLGYNPMEAGLIVHVLTKFFPVINSMDSLFHEADVLIRELLGSKEVKDRNPANEMLDEWSSLYKDIVLADDREVNVTTEELLTIMTTDFQDIEDEDVINRTKIMLYKIIMGARLVANITSNSKVDTSKMTAGPFIASTRMHRYKIRKMRELMEMYPLLNNWSAFEDLEEDALNYSNKKQMFELLSNTDIFKVPLLQSYYSLGLQAERQLIGKYFFHYKEDIEDAIELLEEKIGRNLNENVLRNFYQDLLLYIMTNTSPYLGETGNSKEAMIDIIKNVPNELAKLKKSIKGNSLLDYLVVYKSKQNIGVPVIEARRTAKLSPETKKLIRAGWEELFTNPATTEFAVRLFVYASLKNGFSLGRNTFINFTPTALRKSLGGYSDVINNFKKSSRIDLQFFVNQFIRNNVGTANFMISRKGIKMGNAWDPPQFTIYEEQFNDNLYKGLFVVRREIRDNRVRYFSRNVEVFQVYTTGSKYHKEFLYVHDPRDNEYDESGNLKSITYKRVERLGVKGELKEYNIDHEDHLWTNSNESILKQFQKKGNSSKDNGELDPMIPNYLKGMKEKEARANGGQVIIPRHTSMSSMQIIYNGNTTINSSKEAMAQRFRDAGKATKDKVFGNLPIPTEGNKPVC